VVASYSLYFFPGLVPEVARVVVPGGRFVVITHRETSLRSLLDVLGLPVAEAPQVAALHACSAETAPSVLKPWFGTVEERPYHNELVFERSDLGDLLTYVRFKLPLIIRGFPIGSDVPTPVVERAREALDGDGRIVIAKDDSVFVCTGPARP